jgi:hypothetical protein
MKKTWFRLLLGIAGIASSAGLAVAHHSFSAVFDADQPIALSGRVTEVEWLNPHVWFFVDVDADDGEVQNWGFEMGSPNGLIRRGWRHDSLQPGQVVTVEGVRARDGSQRAAVRSVSLPDGTSLFGAQNESN